MIGILKIHVNCSHPERAYTVNQCARFYIEPKYSHEKAVERIIKYLIGTFRNNRNKRETNQGIIYSSDKSKSVETIVDASFAGYWNQRWSEDPISVMSRTGYMVMYTNCPII